MKISKATWDELAAAALAVRKRAYAPYSKFRVGAALLTAGDEPRIISGCNVENASYGLAICAERAAVANAVAAGELAFSALAIATGTDDPAPPCGMCRQVLVEFCEELDIVLINTKGVSKRVKLSKLLPQAFRLRPIPSKA